ncbi:hypothetical protein VTK73DRAFT_6327 [Phialemonium thermophilum]|uniref:Secreted protein n=1 Tax=Phialemonium thermophilum TaxID=223376 RepID=A0ABR3UZX0_9PEZI
MGMRLAQRRMSAQAVGASVLVVVGMVVGDGFVVRVVAVDHVRRHELVEHPGDELDAEEAGHEAGYHDEACLLLLDAALVKVARRRRQHAVQGGEQLCMGRQKTDDGTLPRRAVDDGGGLPTMTPKLRLSDEAKKVLLSWIRKFRLPGKRRTIKSTHMTLVPTTQANDEVSHRG